MNVTFISLMSDRALKYLDLPQVTQVFMLNSGNSGGFRKKAKKTQVFQMLPFRIYSQSGKFDSSTNKLVVICIMNGLCSLISTIIFTMLHALMDNPPYVFGLRGQNYPVAVVPVYQRRQIRRQFFNYFTITFLWWFRKRHRIFDSQRLISWEVESNQQFCQGHQIYLV